MALSAAIAWEVRSGTGSDLNGGGFKAGATGVDYSQQAAAQYALTNGVTNGTTTVATASAATNMVGNVAYIAGGTGAVVGAWYEITAASAGVSITVDRSTGLTAGTGVTINVGGALATLGAANAVVVGSNKIFATGSETRTATLAVAAIVTPAAGTPLTRVIGYSSTRTDNGKYAITLSTNTGLSGVSFTGNGVLVENISVDCASLGTSKGFLVSNFYNQLLRSKASNFTSVGIDASAGTTNVLFYNEATGGTSAASGGIKTGATTLTDSCHVHDNACPGIAGGAVGGSVCGNIVVNNSGASSDGIVVGWGCTVGKNICHNNGRDGIFFNSSNPPIPSLARGNILTSNGRYGLNMNSSGAIAASVCWDGNAYWNNTTAARHFADDTTGINGVSPYTNVYDVTLTGSPYVAAGTDPTTANWGLNATAGAGAACRNAFGPSTWPGNTLTTAYNDFGPIQHADSGAGGIIASGLSGGLG